MICGNSPFWTVAFYNILKFISHFGVLNCISNRGDNIGY